MSITRGKRRGRRDHAGARRGRADDDRLPAAQHRARRLPPPRSSRSGFLNRLAVRCLSRFAIKLRPMIWRWIWLVPSQIWVILASRISRSTR